MNDFTDSDAASRLTATRLVEALNNHQFLLYCQPIVRLRSVLPSHGYVEILTRFLEEEQLLLPPGTFLPVLEDAGLMPLLDRWVVREVLKWLKAQRELKPDRALPRCGINLSGSAINDRQFATYVKHEIHASGVPPEKLSFEFSMEHIRSRRQSFVDMVGQFRQLNFATAVSGFGMGPSALQGLSNAGVRIIKIDGALVRMLGRRPAAVEKLRSITQACAVLGLLSVAEMVEEPDTVSILRDCGVDYAQGFGIGLPIPLAQFI